MEQKDLPVQNNQESDQNEEIQKKQRRPWWKRLILWFFGIIGALMALLIILTGLLYVPSIQDWITQKSISTIEKATGYDIEIGRIRIGFPLKLKVDDVKAVDRETGMLVGDIEKLTAEVSIIPLLKGGQIPISGIQLNHAIVDYTLPSDSLTIYAKIGQFRLSNFDLDTKSMEMVARKLKLHDASIDLHILVDTVPSEKPKEPSNLLILLDRADLSNISGDVLILPDSTQLSVQINEGKITDGEVNMREEYYQAKRVNLKAFVGYLGSDIESIPFPWIAELKAKNIRYGGVHNIDANISEIYYETGDGWAIKDGAMNFHKDSTNLFINDLSLKLPESDITGYAHLPFKEWLPDSIGAADLKLSGRLNPSDLKRFIGNNEGLPDDIFDIDLTAQGYIEKKIDADITINKKQLIDLDIKANAESILSEHDRKLTAKYSISTGEDLMKTITHFMNKGKEGGTPPSWRIPEGVSIEGDALYSPRAISAHLTLKNIKGETNLDAKVKYNPNAEKYFADLLIQELPLNEILPNDSIGVTSGLIVMDGMGTDIYSPKTNFVINAVIDSISYKSQTLRRITLLSELNNNQFFAAIDSPNDAIKMTAQADATIKKEDLVGSINIFVDTIIPSQLGLNMSMIESARLELRSNLRSDLKENHQFTGEIENFFITTDKNKIHPTNTYIKANTSDIAMNAEVTSGDLSLKFEAKNGLNDFSSRVKQVVAEVQTSLADSLGQINMAPWIMHYPDMTINFKMGRNNLLRAYMDEYRIGAQSASLNLATSTDKGLTGLGVISYLQVDTFRIDNIDLVLRQDSLFFNAVSTVHKERFRNQLPFDILFSLTSNVLRSEAYLNWLDSKNEQFVNLGLELWNKSNGDLTFKFTPDPIILAYNTFNITDEDYVTLPNGKTSKLDADIELTSPEGATVSFKSVPSDKGTLSRAVIKDLKLSQLDGIEFVPNLKGLLNVEMDWLQLPEKGSNINGHILIDKFEFEKKAMGTLEVFADANMTDNDLTLESQIDLNQKEVIDANFFNPKKIKDGQKFAISIKELPLDKANPFLPGKYAELSGQLNGQVSNYDTRLPIKEAKKLSYAGEIRMRDAKLYTAIANETYEMDSQTIPIREGMLRLDDYALTANDRKMLLKGTFDLENNNEINLRVTGDDILLLNSKQTKNTMIFGVVNADADLKLTGPIKAINIRGDVSLLGNTNVTYQSQKSELQNRNNYKDLVNFTYFSDTLFVAKKSNVDSLTLGGMDIRLGLHIDPATKINAILTDDEANSLSVQGGGDFNLVIPPYGEMNLNGTYDIQEGDIFFSQPPISRKFIIRQGSRVVWSGDIMEPQLNFKATARIKTNVTPPGEPSRQVDFDVNIIAEDRLDKLNLRFETEAVQDLTMKNILSSMSPEEQNRQSMLLLTTGRFLTMNSNASSNRGFDVNSAISSVLASQINSLAGEALDAEINLGVSDGTNAYGQGTNYSYSFTKSFYNNRISMTIGGKMVTGEAASGIQQSFIDKFSLDYRLDKAGNQYLRLFHNKNYENLLDGEVTETGGGYVIRRRLHKLTDLFKFKKEKKEGFEPIEETPADTIPAVEPSKETPALPKEDKSISKEPLNSDEE